MRPPPLAGVLGGSGVRFLSRQGATHLGRDDDGVDHERLNRAVGVLLVLDRDLRLAVGAEPPERAVLADVGQLLAQSGGHEVRQRHAVGSLVTSVAEHDALVARAHVHLVFPDVDAARDVRRLLVDAHEHLAGVAA